MTKDEIMNAWKSFIEYPPGSDERFVTTTSAILFAEHVVSIAVEAEREACAAECDLLGGDVDPRDPDEVALAANSLADAIRARGTT